MRRKWMILALLVALPLAVFWQTRNFDFVWDDEVNVARNPHLSDVTQFWRKSYEGLYIPITYTVWAGIASFARFSNSNSRADLNPSPFHLANIALHILNTVLVFAILMILIRNDWAACAGALLFAIHPLQVEPVAWITGMKDILSVSLSLLAIWQYLLYSTTKMSLAAAAGSKRAKSDPARDNALKRKARLHYFGATVAFLVALLAKPSAVVTPAIALLLDLFIVKRPLRDSAVELGSWLLIAIPALLITKLSQPESDLEFVTPLWARPWVAADALTFYIYKLLAPFWLAPDYGRTPQLVIEQKWIYVTWVVPVAAAILIGLAKQQRPWLIAAAGIFAVGFLPVSGLIPFKFQNSSTVADRYLYLSMFGPALAVAWLFSKPRKAVMAVACSVLLLVLASVSTLQARHWQDETALFGHILQLNPRSWAAHYGFGRALVRHGNTTDAISHFREAARLQPEFTKAHFSLGGLLTGRGELDEAVSEYRKAVAIAPNFVDAYVGWGNALAQRGQLDEAIGRYQRALELDPRRSDICFALGNAWVRKGSLSEAAAAFEQAIRLRPDFLAAHNNLGRVLAAQGNLSGATDHFREALRLDPTFAEAHESLALALAEQGKREEAERHALEAQRLRTYRPQQLRLN